MPQPSSLDRVLYQDERFFQRERLLREIVGAQLGGTHRGLDRAVAGDHDYPGGSLSARIFSSASRPSIPGSHTSSWITSKLDLRRSSRQSSPLAQGAVLWICSSRIPVRGSRTPGLLSSTTTSAIISPPECQWPPPPRATPPRTGSPPA